MISMSLGRKKVQVIYQAEAAECGLACIAMIANFHGYQIDLITIRQRCSTSLSGMTLRGLIAVASELRLAARPVRLSLNRIDELRCPAIIYWNFNHYVVLEKASKNSVSIVDPTIGRRRISLEDFSRSFTGVALELSPTVDFQRRSVQTKFGLLDIVQKTDGLRTSVAKVIALSLCVQLLVILGPMYLRIVIDDVLTVSDSRLLLALTIGFAGLAIFQAVATFLRSTLLVVLSSSLTRQMGLNLFDHMLRLPLTFFHKRSIGAVVSRFRSINRIRELLTQDLITVVVDAVMAAATLAMMLVVEWHLGAVIVFAFLIYLGVYSIQHDRLRAFSEELLVAEAQESTSFLETVRGIQTLKIFSGEAQRLAKWQDSHVAVTNAETNRDRSRVTFGFWRDVLFGTCRIAVIYLGARFILSGNLSVGLLFAFIAYQQQFIEKATALLDKAFQFRLMAVYVSRLSDIALEAPELVHVPKPMARLSEWRSLSGQLEAENLRFRYGSHEREILSGVSFKLAAGENIAITGSSGSGKSTLIRILIGLYTQTSGRLLIDGLPISDIGLSAYRAQIGVVMQDDQLLSGSVADNISFFSDEHDQALVEEVARLSGIHEDIMQMPMQYESLVGDMGTVLSGGQKQRILLARALYRKPRILVLDEGTANLDLRTEAAIVDNISRLGISRISVAHRSATIDRADRVLLLSDGLLTECRQSLV